MMKITREEALDRLRKCKERIEQREMEMKALYKEMCNEETGVLLNK